MTESPADLLQRAADHLEGLASKVTPGVWSAKDLTPFGRDGVWWVESEHKDNEGTMYCTVAELETRNAANNAPWAATMSPSVAAPLVAWLRYESRFVRRNAKYMGGTEQELPSVQFARLILGEH